MGYKKISCLGDVVGGVANAPAFVRVSVFVPDSIPSHCNKLDSIPPQNNNKAEIEFKLVAFRKEIGVKDVRL
jgi:hypothetical protein